MKSTYNKKRQQGFTIIEVLIVLAIAALILLIVFLAVPALQRNSRNTSRKADVSNSLASINEFVANNSGSFPGTVAGTTTLTWGTAPGDTTSETKVGYYNQGVGTTPGRVDYHSTTAAGASLAADAAHDYVAIYAGGACNGNAVVVGAPRSVAALYLVENGSNSFSPQCLSS